MFKYLTYVHLCTYCSISKIKNKPIIFSIYSPNYGALDQGVAILPNSTLTFFTDKILPVP